MYGSSRSVSKLDVVGSNGNGSVSGSPGRSPRLPRSPRLGHRRNSSSSSAGGLTGSGKTLSMENIQSLNAAYATGGPMYFTDTADDPVGIGSLGSGLNPSLPKNTMTLGRAGARMPYGVRAAIMGSSPNINTGGGGAVMPSDAIAFGGEMQNQPSQASTVPHSMRQVRLCSVFFLNYSNLWIERWTIKENWKCSNFVPLCINKRVYLNLYALYVSRTVKIWQKWEKLMLQEHFKACVNTTTQAHNYFFWRKQKSIFLPKFKDKRWDVLRNTNATREFSSLSMKEVRRVVFRYLS